MSLNLKLAEALKRWSVKQVLLDKPQRRWLRPRVAGPRARPLERTPGQEGASTDSGETESLEQSRGGEQERVGPPGSSRVPAAPARCSSQAARPGGVGV